MISRARKTLVKLGAVMIVNKLREAALPPEACIIDIESDLGGQWCSCWVMWQPFGAADEVVHASFRCAFHRSAAAARPSADLFRRISRGDPQKLA